LEIAKAWTEERLAASSMRWVATDDVAALVASVTLEPDPPQGIDFGGPEALTRNQTIELASG
jgi:uncharacterized protein YbjT (DUF2867 family)